MCCVRMTEADVILSISNTIVNLIFTRYSVPSEKLIISRRMSILFSKSLINVKRMSCQRWWKLISFTFVIAIANEKCVTYICYCERWAAALVFQWMDEWVPLKCKWRTKNLLCTRKHELTRLICNVSTILRAYSEFSLNIFWIFLSEERKSETVFGTYLSRVCALGRERSELFCARGIDESIRGILLAGVRFMFPKIHAPSCYHKK